MREIQGLNASTKLASHSFSEGWLSVKRCALSVIFISCLTVLLIAACFAQVTAPVGSGLPGYDSPLVERFRLQVVNEQGGAISVSTDGGETWQQIGKVVRHCEKVEPKGFTASKWIQPVRITATAVNAVHVTANYDPNTDRASVFSFIPKGIIDTGASYYSPSAQVVTDIPAGGGMFGGGWAPLVGNDFWLERDGLLCQPEPGYVPARGDKMLIIVSGFEIEPTQAVFENRERGAIYLQFPDGSRKVIGKVVRPVHGVGRFLGTQFAAPGRIRANHPGVIDVACSALGKIAGFQIIPEHHAHSPEMGKALTQTQWMVIAPLDSEDHWEGMPPFFYQHIRPNYKPSDFAAPDWGSDFLARFLVEVRHGDGSWVPCPALAFDPNMNKPLPDWANTALQDVTAVRIMFPVTARTASGAQ